MTVCLGCAREMLAGRRSSPCGACILASARDRRAEARAAVARFADEWDREMGRPDLSNLPVSHSNCGEMSALDPEERRAKNRAYMRDWRVGRRRGK